MLDGLGLRLAVGLIWTRRSNDLLDSGFKLWNRRALLRALIRKTFGTTLRGGGDWVLNPQRDARSDMFRQGPRHGRYV